MEIKCILSCGGDKTDSCEGEVHGYVSYHGYTVLAKLYGPTLVEMRKKRHPVA